MYFYLVAAFVALTLSVNAHASVSIEEINNRKVELERIESATPVATVVFENGLRQTLDTWGSVIEAIKSDTTVFAYNRPGYGNSEEAQTRRDGRTIVEDLRGTLRHQGLKPPYVLVGHSLGGLYVQLFARAYPQEVSGIVLVDAVYPGVIMKPEDFPLYTRVARHLIFSKTVNQEIDEIHNTGSAVLALPWTNRIPVVRLINVPKSAGAIGVDFGVMNSGPKLRAMVEGLYPNAKTTIVDSDHQIQTANPEVVADAIRMVIRKNAE